MQLARSIASERLFLGAGRQFANGGSFQPNPGYLYAIPLEVLGLSVDAICLDNMGFGSGDAVCRAGIYAADGGQGLPGTLLASAPEQELDNGHIGLRTMMLGEPLTLTGTEYLAIAFGGETPPPMRSCMIVADECQRIFGHYNLSSAPNNFCNALAVSFSYGELPETFPLEGVQVTHFAGAVAVRAA